MPDDYRCIHCGQPLNEAGACSPRCPASLAALRPTSTDCDPGCPWCARGEAHAPWRRRMTIEEAQALLVLVRGGWLKLELAL